MMKILIVHGIGNYRSSVTSEVAAEILRKSWMKNLTEGVTSADSKFEVRLSVAYYAHLLHNREVQGSVLDQTMNPDEVKLFLSWAEAFGMPGDQAQGVVTKPIRQVISWVASRGMVSTDAVTSLVLRFIREVNEYFTSDTKRDQVRSLVENRIRSEHPDLVLAHSLGSVVAYEALWNSGIPLKRFITVGSPLALKGGIFDRVVPGPIDGLGRRPSGVGEWLNVADYGDIVAVPRLLSRSYSGIRIDQEINIGVFAFHGLNNYLKSPELRQLIYGDGLN
jgi:hypothetical protein